MGKLCHETVGKLFYFTTANNLCMVKHFYHLHVLRKLIPYVIIEKILFLKKDYDKIFGIYATHDALLKMIDSNINELYTNDHWPITGPHIQALTYRNRRQPNFSDRTC